MTTYGTHTRERLAATLRLERPLTASLDYEADVILREFIVIPRTDLPKVTHQGGIVTARDLSLTDRNDPKRLRDEALDALAIAEHLERHPPVNEAQVDALADALGRVGPVKLTDLDRQTLARRLVQAGVRAPEAGDTK